MKKIFTILVLLFSGLSLAQNQGIILFVSPDGNNDNSGLTKEVPLKTINYALTKLNGNSGVTDTICLLPGTYSKGTNGEVYDIKLKSNLCLTGSGVDESILMGDNTTGILFIDDIINITIKDLTIKNGNNLLGGGIYCYSSSPRIENVIISNCYAFQGGAINCMFGAIPVLVNVLIHNNIAKDWGGALYAYHAGYILINVTISDNKSQDLGGGIYCQSSFVRGVNSIIWNNTPQQVFFYDLDSPNLAEFSYSLIQDGRSGIWDNANGTVLLQEGTIIRKDPFFVDHKNGNFRLSDSSYCIGTGINNQDTPREDIEHNSRQDFNSVADLGAYENKLSLPVNGFIIAEFSSLINEGDPPLTVQFKNLTRASMQNVSWKWDFNNDGLTDSNEKEPSWIYNEPGLYTVSLTASDGVISDSFILKDFINIHNKGIIWVSTSGSDSGNGTAEKPFFSIQRGINAADYRDSVLLEPGIYNENIDFKGKNITVGSRYLLTQDTAFISSTRISGKPGDNVVKFLNYENHNAVLAGLTVENGKNIQEGGGIYCRGSQPVLKNLIITNNSSIGFGGGLACRYSAHPVISDVIFSNNTSSMGGGVSCIGNSNPRIERALFINNTVSWEGSAINILDGSAPVIINCTVTENPGSSSGTYIEHSSPLLLNSIFWNNGKYEIKLFGTAVTIGFSDIKGGPEAIKSESGFTMDWLPNNINIDPEFVTIASGNYYLSEESKCIDSGTPFYLWQNEVLLNLFHQYYSGSNPDIGMFENDNVTRTDNELSTPSEYKLFQNYPNPFNPSTIISYQLPAACKISLKVYNTLGEELTTLVNEEKSAGSYKIEFDGNSLPSGVYFYKIQTGTFTDAKKFILMK